MKFQTFANVYSKENKTSQYKERRKIISVFKEHICYRQDGKPPCFVY